MAALRTDRVPHVDKVTADDINTISSTVNNNDTAAMHLANPETVTGTKTFTSPPAVPDPIGLTDAANRQFVMSYSDRDFTMTYVGSLVAGQLVPVLPIFFPCKLTSITLRIVTAPTGASAIFDVYRNGTTSAQSIFAADPTKRPTIPTGQFLDVTPGTDASVNSYLAGDWLAMVINQAGSTVPGADLTAIFSFRPI